MGNTPKVEKIIIMEPQNENATPSSHRKLEDLFARALKEMKERLTQKMREMIDPLTTSLNSLVSQQKDWEQQRTDVKELQVEKIKMNQKMKILLEKNDKLETRVKHLEQKLLENNIIVHGVKESKWELDSTRHELVTQMLAATVTASTDEEKLQIARNIPISSTSRLGWYKSMHSRPIRITFACKSDTDLLMERKKKLEDGVFVDREYSEEEKERKLL